MSLGESWRGAVFQGKRLFPAEGLGKGLEAFVEEVAAGCALKNGEDLAGPVEVGRRDMHELRGLLPKQRKPLQPKTIKPLVSGLSVNCAGIYYKSFHCTCGPFLTYIMSFEFHKN